MSLRLSPHATVIARAATLAAACCLFAASASALQKTIKSKAHNYPKAPVELKRSEASLVETYTNPTQFMVQEAKTRTTRVRYANRAGLAPSVFQLKGEVQCTNTGAQAVDAMSLTIVALDAFHEPLDMAGAGGAFAEQQITETLPRGATRRISWEQVVRSPDVYEIAVVVTRVRFADGTVWTAPAEELLDIF